MGKCIGNVDYGCCIVVAFPPFAPLGKYAQIGRSKALEMELLAAPGIAVLRQPTKRRMEYSD